MKKKAHKGSKNSSLLEQAKEVKISYATAKRYKARGIWEEFYRNEMAQKREKDLNELFDKKIATANTVQQESLEFLQWFLTEIKKKGDKTIDFSKIPDIIRLQMATEIVKKMLEVGKK